MGTALLHRCILVLSMIAPVFQAAQPSSLPSPKYEVRAVWIATAAGLDWPRTRDMSTQQSSLRTMIRRLHAAQFNTIFFQVRARGDAYYRSGYEPWAENLTGMLGKDPGWDPLQFLLDEAHALGMEVHAWFNVYKIRGPGGNIPWTTPPHPARAFPQWTVPAEGELWFDPGIPGVRDYTLNVALDLITNYDIDGIQFDFIRYPGRDFPDDGSFRQFGKGMDRAGWRRANIDAFVFSFYDSATARKPMLKVGSAPLGVFSAGNGKDGWGAFLTYYQDAQGWLKKKKHDYLVPQIYWDIGESLGDPDFIALAQSWQENAAGRHVYAGIGAYKPAVMDQIPRQIDAARERGTLGQAYFRYGNIEAMDMFGGRYATHALIPPMPWKGAAPMPPAVVAVTEFRPDVLHIEWSSAPDATGTHQYAIYRWHSAAIPVGDARTLVATVPAGRQFYSDTLARPHGIRHYYAVSAIDRAGNEGPVSVTAQVVIREMADLHRRLSGPTRLAAGTMGEREPSPLIGYRLAERSDVSLDIRSIADPHGYSRHMVDSIQQPGTYIVSIGSPPLPPGRYAVRLRFSGATLEQHIRVEP